ncbi:ABC transporter substrate-binding protein [Nocardia aurantia]|uniref:Solute-binding protein family 5 domain-containing protein n=1 Tax=Nocardia aurantia TaxID=2585199 RepID=A0A7K0DKA6_9NOCA|nr:ABC transporter substrate-binding protein [Nocardia aurantia]MQY26139.1 hypothetical protein [Nocardia aurantia]
MTLTRAGSPGFSRRGLLRAGLSGAAALAAGPILAACAGPAGTGGTTGGASAPPKRGGTLRMAQPATTAEKMMPLILPAMQLRGFQMFDPLVQFEAGEGNHGLAMMLAESITMDSATQCTVVLKPGLTFHNGKPIGPDDIVATMRRAGTEPGSSYSTAFTNVDFGATRALDARTLRCVLQSPESTFAENFVAVPIMPADYDIAAPVGSGAYRLASYVPGERSVCVRFENYWNSELAYFDTVETLTLADKSTIVTALLGKQIDLASNIPANSIPVVEAQGFRKTQYATGNNYIINMNTQFAPLDRVEVRQALRTLINRQEIIAQVYGGLASPGTDVYTPLDAAYDTTRKPPAADPARAMAVLRQAGLDKLPLTVSTTAGAAGIVDMAKAFTQQAVAAGLPFKAQELDAATYYGAGYANRPLSTSFWPGESFTSMVKKTRLPNSPYNSTHWSNERFNALYRNAMTEMDVAKRTEIFREMQDIEAAEGSMIVVLYPKLTDVAAPHIQGMAAQSMTQNVDVRTLWSSR